MKFKIQTIIFYLSISPQAIIRLKYDAGTFYYVQYCVNNNTEHVPDVAHDSTHGVICYTEDISADHHWVQETDVCGSWIKRQKMS